MKNKFLKELYDIIEQHYQGTIKELVKENEKNEFEQIKYPIDPHFVCSILDKEFDNIKNLKEYVEKYLYYIYIDNNNYGYDKICSIHVDFFETDKEGYENYINKGFTFEISSYDNGAPYEEEWDEPNLDVYEYNYIYKSKLGYSLEEFGSWKEKFSKEILEIDEIEFEKEKQEKINFLKKEKEKIEEELKKLEG